MWDFGAKRPPHIQKVGDLLDFALGIFFETGFGWFVSWVWQLTITELRATKAMTYGFFHQRKASIRERLEEAVGPLAEAYTIHAIETGKPAATG